MRLHVVSPGPLTTVQDLGRTGWRHLGVGCCGVLDPVAARVANRLVGNAPGEAVLEMTLQGPTLRFEQPVTIALCGAMVAARFEDEDGDTCTVYGGRPAALPAGTLRIGLLHGGARAWMAVAGGIDVPPVLGSRSTDLRGGFGGLDGRALQAGDVLPIARQADADDILDPRIPSWWVDPLAHERDLPIRYVPSAHPLAVGLSSRAWRASPRSDRQGVRLEDGALEAPREEQISAAVAPGTVQLPPDGRPIVLLADAQTVGGYPRLGHVVSADLPRLAQLRPGERVRFEACDLETATRLACAADARIARIALMIELQFAKGNLG